MLFTRAFFYCYAREYKILMFFFIKFLVVINKHTISLSKKLPLNTGSPTLNSQPRVTQYAYDSKILFKFIPTYLIINCEYCGILRRRCFFPVC